MENEILNSKLSTIKINHEFSKLKKKKQNVIFQSLLFPIKNFDLANVKKWADDHNYKSSNIKVPKDGKFIHMTLKEPGRFNAYKTILLSDGVKARIATNSCSKFAGQMMLRGFSKFSDKVKSDNDIKIPMAVEFHILCEGQNRDGFIKREDLEESLELWDNIPVIDFHDKSKDPTSHKMYDRKGYTVGSPYLKVKDGKMWIIAPGEIINRDLAYQAYIREMRGKPLEISAEFGWNKYQMNGKTYQTNIRPQIFSIVEKGHIDGNKIAILAS